jgi:streptogramin lyase
MKRIIRKGALAVAVAVFALVTNSFPASAIPILFGTSDSIRALYTIDPATGMTALVGPTRPFPGAEAIEFHGVAFAAYGTLFGTGGSTSLYRIDPATGVTTLIGPTRPLPGAAPIEFETLTFGPDGALFGTGDPTSLYRIDPATGTTTFIGPTRPFADASAVEFQALAFAPISVPASVPEPSTLALFGAGLLGLGATLRRRTHNK